MLAIATAVVGLGGAANVFSEMWPFEDWYVPWLLPVTIVPLLVLPFTVGGRPGRRRVVLGLVVCAAVIAIGLIGVGLLVWGCAGGWEPTLCCEATRDDMPWLTGEVVAGVYAAAGAAMLLLFVAAVRRDRAFFRARETRAGVQNDFTDVAMSWWQSRFNKRIKLARRGAGGLAGAAALAAYPRCVSPAAEGRS